MVRYNRHRYYDAEWNENDYTYDELENVKELLDFDQSIQESPTEPLDERKIEDYAFKVLSNEYSIDDIPADYQEAVKEKRLKILRGEW